MHTQHSIRLFGYHGDFWHHRFLTGGIFADCSQPCQTYHDKRTYLKQELLASLVNVLLGKCGPVLLVLIFVTFLGSGNHANAAGGRLSDA